MSMKKGDMVRQKVHVIEGPIKSIRYDEDAGTFMFLVEYIDENDEIAERWFDDDHVEPIEPAEPAKV